MRPRFPEVVPEYFPLGGGLDLVSPPISIPAGKLYDVQNYEPNIAGGYSRVAGFERFDGHTQPSTASYWVLSATVSSAIALSATVTGATSGATGKVLVAATTATTTLVLGRVTGTFQAGENLQVAAVTVAVSGGIATENGASAASDHADWRALAANDRRADISAITGSGDIRGGFVYQDICYAFRDNAGGTAGQLWKQTASGWAQVTFGRELQFDGAVGQVLIGNTVTGATSGATGVVVRALLRTGTWTASGVGTLIFTTVTGAFQDNESVQVGGVTKVTANGVDTAISRLPGGKIEAVEANFTGSTATKRIYGCDGVNIAFEFDGTNYIPIRSGMASDAPTHIWYHYNHLFLTFIGSLQYSAPGDPYSYTLLTGANEIGMGDDISGMRTVAGSYLSPAMAVFTNGRTSILYGTGSSNFQLIASKDELGVQPYTVQLIGNDVYGLTSTGIQALGTTQQYGGFLYAAISFLIEPLLRHKREQQITPTASVVLKSKNQYRLYYSDNSCIVVGLTGTKPNGITVLDYGLPVKSMWSGKLSTGEEVTFFGSTNGYVYKDNVGTSFDGSDIEAWIRLAFNNSKSPQIRKQYRRAVFEVASKGYSVVKASYDIGYAKPIVSAAAVQADQTLTGEGGYWGQFIWGQFTWDSPVVSQAQLSLDGTENNISLYFYSKRAKDDPHTISGVTLLHSLRRLTHSGS